MFKNMKIRKRDMLVNLFFPRTIFPPLPRSNNPGEYQSGSLQVGTLSKKDHGVKFYFVMSYVHLPTQSLTPKMLREICAMLVVWPFFLDFGQPDVEPALKDSKYPCQVSINVCLYLHSLGVIYNQKLYNENIENI